MIPERDVCHSPLDSCLGRPDQNGYGGTRSRVSGPRFSNEPGQVIVTLDLGRETPDSYPDGWDDDGGVDRR